MRSFLCICHNINLYIFTDHEAFSVKADAFHVRYFIDFSDKTAVAIKLIPAGDLPDSVKRAIFFWQQLATPARPHKPT